MPTTIPNADAPGLTPTGDLADAIRALLNVSAEATVPEIELFKVSDGKGGEREIPVVMLPSGNGTMKAHPLLDTLQAGTKWAREQRLLDAAGPDARQGTAVHQALGSFIEHTNRFRAVGTVVWADPSSRKLVAVLDYHQEGAESPAAWGRHRATYSPPVSEAWAAWGGVGGLSLDQDQFAALLDTRDMDLTVGTLKDPTGKDRPAPSPADLVTLAGTLETFSETKAKRVRDQNGRTRLEFVQESGTSGVSPPSAFLLKIRVFEDAPPQQLEVRLRVTVEEGVATFAVRIHNGAEVLREAFEGICADVRTRVDRPVFIGTAEA